MNVATAIFLIISAFCLGIAAGGLIANFRQEKKSGALAEPSQPEDLLRVRKDSDSGALEVLVAGQTFHSAAEMNAVQRSLAGYVANDLRAWLFPQTATEQVVSKPAPVAITPAVTADGPVQAAVAATPAALGVAPVRTSTPVVVPEIPDPEAEDPNKKKRGGLIGVLTRALSTDVPSNRIFTKSIAVQVNEILQKKIKDTPLEERGILLMELPGNDMVVMIGLDKYDSVSAVPDDEIRAVLQSAVNDWLAKSSS